MVKHLESKDRAFSNVKHAQHEKGRKRNKKMTVILQNLRQLQIRSDSLEGETGEVISELIESVMEIASTMNE